MASDFFYPNMGGVESHIWQLSQCLLELNHKIIVITHAYNDRVGVRYMTNGIKVYYLPFLLFPGQSVIWPLLFHTFPIVRYILIREQIDIVHGHSAFSPLAHEVMFHAKTLGINAVFTNHSLFGFNDFGAIVLNKFVKMSLILCNHLICVSHIGKENTALRVGADPSKIWVIPNAVDTHAFTPDPSKRDPKKITIVINSRLVYRKGIDLLAMALPTICKRHQNIRVLIAGDGPKRILLEEVIENHHLQDRVKFFGAVPHDHVRDILVCGDIFLNASLTEAFCMAIVEAASCGLQVVSTSVGGIPEVLPPELMKLTEPSVEGLIGGVERAIQDITRNRCVPPSKAHQIVSRSYCWMDVARRTELVYKSASEEPTDDLEQRVNKFRCCGLFFGFFFIILAIIEQFLLIMCEWITPAKDIDICPSMTCALSAESKRQP